MNNPNEIAQQNLPNIVIYSRDSSKSHPLKQKRQKQSVQELKAMYEQAGYSISNIYLEPFLTSYEKERPVLQQMIKDAASGLFHVVLVWDVFTLASNGEQLQQIERELTSYGVEICSSTEEFDTSTHKGKKVFECMCKLLNTDHLYFSALQSIPLSQVARWFLEDDSKKNVGGRRT
ncbi:recombinase family protein [Thalassobacillus sp. CUG 92003]|uniref:recombinase family protein n=1 Tax=Thalassobacillus sp. CUG 92003 TaxID=2736641 RepID=UPI0015E7136B|nr:recombinase family protein [Thalassobacillus sp. CUG 92003]